MNLCVIPKILVGGGSFSSVEMQSVFSTIPADRAGVEVNEIDRKKENKIKQTRKTDHRSIQIKRFWKYQVLQMLGLVWFGFFV